MNTHIFPTQQDVAKAVAEVIAAEVKNEKDVYIALSGGSTPKILFAYLAEHYAEAIPWQHVHLFWGDERCVAPEDDDSNYGMTKRLLLDKVNIPEENVHRVKGELGEEDANKYYEEEVRKVVPVVNGLPQFDINLLGMGDDGHTASIFPHEMDLLDADSFTAVATHPTSGQKRITLTGPVINNSRQVIFMVTGAGKADRVKEISQGTGAVYPASHIHAANDKAEWYLDEAAASHMAK